MKIKLRGNSHANLGGIIRDAEIEPIAVYFTESDRQVIAKMPESCERIIFFPDGMKTEVAYAMLGERFADPNGPGIDGGRCAQIIEALECGSLDSALAMIREGLPKKVIE